LATVYVKIGTILCCLVTCPGFLILQVRILLIPILRHQILIVKDWSNILLRAIQWHDRTLALCGGVTSYLKWHYILRLGIIIEQSISHHLPRQIVYIQELVLYVLGLLRTIVNNWLFLGSL
jgi:hypothetical protein